MAKKQKSIVPFFKLKGQMSDTIEALSHELVMTISAIESAVELDHAMSAGIRKRLTERAAALRAVCLSDDDGLASGGI